MKNTDKRHFLDCRSLAEMAFTLVVIGVMLVLPVGGACVLIGLAVGLGERTAAILTLVFWSVALGRMWLRFVRVGRQWTEPLLATREFFLFQMATSVFVLGLGMVFPDPELGSAIGAIRYFFTILFILMNLAYISLAFGIRARLPAKIYAGLVIEIACAALPLWLD